MGLFPLYGPKDKTELRTLETLVRANEATRFILAFAEEAERSGLCPDCGNINNPNHGVQAGGFCACDYCESPEEAEYRAGLLQV